MNNSCPTLVIRHRKERLSKCSLRGLETRDDFQFFSYPLTKDLPLENAAILTVDAPTVLSLEDATRPLLLIDATWRLAEKMQRNIPFPQTVVYRSLPSGYQTAYPRRQDESAGLASIEALYVAFCLTGRDPTGLLDTYHWGAQFLEINSLLPYSGAHASD